jgi:dihydrofolate synthase/folylpolyglutamate synthase
MLSLKEWQKQEYTGMKPGLGRIKSFLKNISDPQRSFKVIHIAGTNGKGSTAAMIAAILVEAGYKTGLYTSPHLCKINERIKINGRDIPGAALNKIVKQINGSALQAGLSFFEFITVAAFVYFASKKVDIVVLETGLGGRLDATNVIKKPLLAVITNIDFDHTKILGNSLKIIAGEKAGIIKPGVSLICGQMPSVALKVIKEKAFACRSKVYVAGRDFSATSLYTDWANVVQRLKFRGGQWKDNFSVGLVGKFQSANAGVAIAAAETLNNLGLKISLTKAKSGILKTQWPARFQILRSGKQVVVIDGAHNPGAMKRFVETFNGSPWKGCKPHIVFGSVKDKDYAENIAILTEIAGKVIVTALNTPRTAKATELAEIWLKHGVVARQATSVKDALQLISKSRVVLVVGSLFLAGEVLDILKPPLTVPLPQGERIMGKGN